MNKKKAGKDWKGKYSTEKCVPISPTGASFKSNVPECDYFRFSTKNYIPKGFSIHVDKWIDHVQCCVLLLDRSNNKNLK